MSDFVLVVVIVAFFVAAALVVRVLDRMIATDRDDADPADEATDAPARELEPGQRA
jgi:hypothetical protein